MSIAVRTLAVALAAMLVASPAAGQGLAACGAKAPAAGALVRGPVLQVIDARTLCVALGPLPQEWLQLRLARGPHGAQAQTMFAQTVTCKVAARQSGPALAVCAVASSGGAALAQLAQGPF
jgi:hypothetical protein